MIATHVRVAAPNQWAIETAEVGPPGPGQVRLELDSGGICGGDLSLLKGMNSVANYPTVLGHECVATVAEVGPQATLTVGAPVAIYPTISCGGCPACLDGRTNNCPTMTVLGLTDRRGCFSSSFVLDESQCIPIPQKVFDLYGALIEPMAVAQHVIGRVGDISGQRLLVIGAGSIGLAIILTAKAMGASNTTAVDILPERASAAKRAGAATFLIMSGSSLVGADGLANSVPDIDVAFDVVARPDTLALCQDRVPPGGRIVLVAAAKPNHTLALDYQRMYGAEQSIASSRNYAREDFTAAATLLATGNVDAAILRTKVVTIAHFGSALDALRDHPEAHLKIMITTDQLIGSRPILTSP